MPSCALLPCATVEAVEKACRIAVNGNVSTVKGMKNLLASMTLEAKTDNEIQSDDSVEPFFSPIYKEDRE